MVLVAQEIIGDNVKNVTSTKQSLWGTFNSSLVSFKGVRVGTI